MQCVDFDVLRQTYKRQHIILAANGPSLSGLNDFDAIGLPIFTVNAGLHLLAAHKLTADLLWIQDTRMMVEKPEMVLPYLSSDLILCAPHCVQLPQMAPPYAPQIIRFNSLSNDGFTRDPRIGAFTGYTSVFGLLQLFRWIAPMKVTIFGLDMGYGSDEPRAYQEKRGLDVDLHVNDRQIAATRKALGLLEIDGIEVDHRSPQSVLKTAVSIP